MHCPRARPKSTYLSWTKSLSWFAQNLLINKAMENAWQRSIISDQCIIVLSAAAADPLALNRVFLPSTADFFEIEPSIRPRVRAF